MLMSVGIIHYGGNDNAAYPLNSGTFISPVSENSKGIPFILLSGFCSFFSFLRKEIEPFFYKQIR